MKLLPSEPSNYDIMNLEKILEGEGDWFDAHLYRFLNEVLFKSDSNNLTRLFTAFPKQCRLLYVRYGWPPNEIDIKFLDAGVLI